MVKGKDNRTFEVCILCSSVTDISIETPVCERLNYVDGAGQLCQKCAEKQKKLI